MTLARRTLLGAAALLAMPRLARAQGRARLVILGGGFGGGMGGGPGGGFPGLPR